HTPGIAGYALAGTDSTPDTSQSFAFAGTVDGSYSIYTDDNDKAGNLYDAPARSDSSTLVDTKDPTSSASSPAYSTSSALTVSYTATAPATDGSAPSLHDALPISHTPGIAGYALAGTDSTPDTSQSFAFAGTVDGSYS